MDPGTRDSDAPPEALEEIKKAAESGSPMVDNVLNATALEGSSVAG